MEILLKSKTLRLCYSFFKPFYEGKIRTINSNFHAKLGEKCDHFRLINSNVPCRPRLRYDVETSRGAGRIHECISEWYTWVNAGLSTCCTFFNTKFWNALCHSTGHASHLFNVFNELYKWKHRLWMSFYDDAYVITSCIMLLTSLKLNRQDGSKTIFEQRISKREIRPKLCGMSKFKGRKNPP